MLRMEINDKNLINSTLSINSLRRQGFSTTFAICEIIDNSIEANATKIKITLEYKKKKDDQKYARINQLLFVDDGDGMEKELLHKCLVLGESTCSLNCQGIGKFGVGATFGGISQGKRIDIFSKTKSGEWLSTYLDLDLLKKRQGMPTPTPKDPQVDPSISHGTVVKWTKIDDESFTENDEKDLCDNIGRIYRKFLADKKIKDGKIIDNNAITITVNGRQIEPYDPLFLTYNRRKEDIEKPEMYSVRLAIGKGETKSHMWITISYLPESWWNYVGADNAHVNTHERCINDLNEGVSVVREGREVLFGDIPYFKLRCDNKRFIDIDRWTGIEISFDRDADDLFKVQNNKSRLIISAKMREKIAEATSRTINTRRQNVTAIRGKRRSEGDESRSDNPKLGTKAIQDGICTPVYTKIKQERLENIVTSLTDDEKKRSEILENLLKGYHIESSYELDPSDLFVSYEYYLNSLYVKYNMNHPFMRAFIETLNSIAKLSNIDPERSLDVKEIRDLRILFDTFMASFGQAKKAMGDPTILQEINFTFDSLVANWSDLTKRYVKVPEQYS